MQFDKEKWDAYVQEQGVENIARKIFENPVYKATELLYSSIDSLIYTITSIEYSPFKNQINCRNAIIFLALGLNIDDFMTEPLPEPLQTITGIEALRALCDGKVLRDIETDALYKVKDNIYLIYHGNDAWDKAHIDINFLLIDKFEVMSCQP